MPKSTSAKLALWCPTYKRPHELRSVAINVEKATKCDFMLYWGCEPDDIEGIKAAKATGYPVIVNKYSQGYSNTIQSIYEATDEPLGLHMNDDFLFLPAWDEKPIAMFETPSVQVVGIRQTDGDTHGSAISMFRRSYIEEQSGVIDIPNRVFYTYHHNYIDTEFTRTAQSRGVWAKCDELVIVHQHPGFTGKEKDETYRKNDATAEIDRRTFESRQHLWG